MKVRTLAILILCVLVGNLLFCGNGGSGPGEDDPTDEHPLIGTWLDTLPAKTDAGLMKAVFIGINIEDTSGTVDSAFLLFAIEDPDKYLYKHEGTWNITGSSLILSGSTCLIIDNSIDSLIPADDTTCSKIVTIDTTGTGEGEWGEKLITEFADVWQSITVFDVFEDWLRSQRLALKKQEIN